MTLFRRRRRSHGLPPLARIRFEGEAEVPEVLIDDLVKAGATMQATRNVPGTGYRYDFDVRFRIRRG